MIPLSSFIITLILFLFESNSNDFNNLTFFGLFNIEKLYSLADAPTNL